MKKILLLAFAVTSLISCSTVQSGTSKTMDIVGTGVIHKPVIADLNVSQEKVSRTMTFTNLQSLETAKNSVVRELLKEQNADVLVEPTFDSTTKNGTTELTVYGWTATYKNFRQVEEKDLKVLEVRPNFIQKAETTQPATELKKKGGLAWIIGGAALVVAAALAATSL